MFYTMTATAISASPQKRKRSKRLFLMPGLFVGVGILLVSVVFSVMLGAAQITPAVVVESLYAYDRSEFDHLVIRTVRLPRVIAGAFVGASLAVAGAIMQCLTRNPLA